MRYIIWDHIMEWSGLATDPCHISTWKPCKLILVRLSRLAKVLKFDRHRNSTSTSILFTHTNNSASLSVLQNKPWPRYSIRIPRIRLQPTTSPEKSLLKSATNESTPFDQPLPLHESRRCLPTHVEPPVTIFWNITDTSMLALRTCYDQ